VMIISVTGSTATPCSARSLARSSSPPLQETTRAERTVVRRDGVERRAAFRACTHGLVALAARLPGDELVTHADPAFYRPFGLVVVRQSSSAISLGFGLPQVNGRSARGVTFSAKNVGKELGKRASELAEAGATGAECGLEDDLDGLGGDRPG